MTTTGLTAQFPCRSCDCTDYEGYVLDTCTCTHSLAAHGLNEEGEPK